MELIYKESIQVNGLYSTKCVIQRKVLYDIYIQILLLNVYLNNLYSLCKQQHTAMVTEPLTNF